MVSFTHSDKLCCVIYEQETYSKTSVPDYKKLQIFTKNNVRLILVNFGFLYKNFKTY